MLQNNFHTTIFPLCSILSWLYVFNEHHSSFEMFTIYNNVRSLISVDSIAGGLTQWIEVLDVLCELKLENVFTCLYVLLCFFFVFYFTFFIVNHCLSLNGVIHVAIFFHKCTLHTVTLVTSYKDIKIHT